MHTRATHTHKYISLCVCVTQCQELLTVVVCIHIQERIFILITYIWNILLIITQLISKYFHI